MPGAVFEYRRTGYLKCLLNGIWRDLFSCPHRAATTVLPTLRKVQIISNITLTNNTKDNKRRSVSRWVLSLIDWLIDWLIHPLCISERSRRNVIKFWKILTNSVTFFINKKCFWSQRKLFWAQKHIPWLFLPLKKFIWLLRWPPLFMVASSGPV